MADQQKNQPQNTNSNKEQDLGQLLKIKREKLAALQEAGKDPFQITKFDVTALPGGAVRPEAGPGEGGPHLRP